MDHRAVSTTAPGPDAFAAAVARLAPDRCAAIALALAGLAAATVARAAPGELVAAYGRGGVASEPAAVLAAPYYATILADDPGPSLQVAPDGSALIARLQPDGRCVLERLPADGLGGVARLGEPVACSARLRPEVGIGPAGEILFAYAPDAATIAVQLRRADGTLEPRFGAAGTAVRPAADGGFVGRAFVQRLADGDVVVIANGTGTSVRLPYSTLYVLRLDAEGGPDALWGRDGMVGFRDFEWGPLSSDGGGLADVSGGVGLYGSSPYAFFLQSMTRTGSYYPYFPPEASVDSAQPIVSEFNDGALAALFAFRGGLYFDGPAARFAASGPADLIALQIPDTTPNRGGAFAAQRFKLLAGGGLLVLARRSHDGDDGVPTGLVLMKHAADGAPDPTFGRDGIAALDLPTGGSPGSLPRTLAAPRPVGLDRIVVASWADGRLAAASLQLGAGGTASAGSLGWLSRRGTFTTALQAREATLRLRVARSGGRRGAVGVAVRTEAPAGLASAYAPLATRLEWADGDDTPRDVAIALRAPPGEPPVGVIDVVLENASGGAVLGTPVQRIELVDYRGGSVAFADATASVAANAGSLRVQVVRSNAPALGAVTATVRVPQDGGETRIPVSWSDGETGGKFVELPFDREWTQFEAVLEPGPRLAVSHPSRLRVSVQAASTAPATSPPPAQPATNTASTGAASGGGGALDPLTLGGLAALLGLAGLLRARRPSRRHRGAGLAVLAAAVATGCGGGDAKPLPPAPAPVVVATRTDRPLVYVGRCHFCTGSSVAAATAELDGRVVPAPSLGPNAVVVARGTESTTVFGNRTTRAVGYDRISARSAVVGRVEWIDTSRGRIGVLGQDVQGLGDWVGAGLTPDDPAARSIAQLAVGERIGVFGYDSTGGRVAGIGVRAAAADVADRVTGFVERVDPGARRLAIGSLEVDYSSARIEDFPQGEPRVGDRIEVIAASGDDRRPLRASALQYRGAPLELADGTIVDASGLVAQDVAPRSPGSTQPAVVLIGGQVLQLGSSCVLESGIGTGFARVLARSGSGGVLQPDASPYQCQLRRSAPNSSAFVTGALDVMDATNGVLRVLDVTLQAQFATRYTDAPDAASASNPFRPGDEVTIGVLPTTTPGRAVAASVFRPLSPIGDATRALFQGWMTAPGADRVIFLGRPILVDGGTRAGLRECLNYLENLRPIAAAQFVPLAFFASDARWVTATVARDGNGGWRADMIEAYDDPLCD